MTTPLQVVVRKKPGIYSRGNPLIWRLFWLNERGARMYLGRPETWSWMRPIMGRLVLVKRDYFKGYKRMKVSHPAHGRSRFARASDWEGVSLGHPARESARSHEVHNNQERQSLPSAFFAPDAGKCHSESSCRYIPEAPNLPCASDTTTRCGIKGNCQPI